MLILNNCRSIFIAALAALAAQSWAVAAFAQTQPISIFIIRHAESDGSQPTVPLTAVGRQRADLLVQTFRAVKFTHVFASHTARSRQMVERISSIHGLSIVQLPVPGSTLDGQTVVAA